MTRLRRPNRGTIRTDMREVAAEWYAGPMYRFVSTGTIDDEVRDEAVDTLTDVLANPYAYDTTAVLELTALVSYLTDSPDTGPTTDR